MISLLFARLMRNERGSTVYSSHLLYLIFFYGCYLQLFHHPAILANSFEGISVLFSERQSYRCHVDVRSVSPTFFSRSGDL